MPFVRRDGGGSIEATFAAIQPGRAEEWLAEDSVEVVTFVNRASRLPAARIERVLLGDDKWRALIAVLADQFAMTPRQIIDAMKAKL